MEIHSEIAIRASAERVWQILTDFDRYPEWNPFIRRVRGEPVRGARLDVAIQPPGGREIEFSPTVLNADPPHELRWLGTLFIPGLFDGEHVFQIQTTGEDGVRLVQRERFIGIAVPLLRWLLEGRILSGFEAMNQALKQRAESGA